MKMKKLLWLVMALMLALSALALADTETDQTADLESQLEAANARIAELEALNELYKPYYEMQIVAEYGDDGIIWKEDAEAQYNYMANLYNSYGISISGYENEIKQSVLESMIQVAVLQDKAEELGFTQLSEETQASLEEEAATSFENYVETYKSYFASEDKTDEEVRQETIDYLESSQVTEQTLLEFLIKNYADEQLYNHVTEGVTVNDEEVQAAYDAKIAENQEEYADDFNYNNARTNGETIAWNPEGYRAVKHVLVKFTDEQATRYSDLQSTLTSLNEELEALKTPETTEEPTDAAEAADAAEAEATAEAEAVEAEATPEPTPEPRSEEEIQADISSIGAEIEALYSELMPKAQEVIDAFNAGTEFDALIEQYGEDGGMQVEPSKSIGYAVAENSTYWESAFVEGAMAIAEVGQISEPVYGSNGIHIIYYMSDITPGAVAFEEISEAVETECLDAKISETYNNQVTAWIEEAAPVYHIDRM